MHTRAIEHVGMENLIFISPGLDAAAFATIPVHGIPVARAETQTVLQRLVDPASAAGKRLAVFPEGPYCAPIRKCRFGLYVSDSIS